MFRKVVNVSSISGTMGMVTQVNYSGAKAAIIGMTKALAKEWGPSRVNVNAVAFGLIDTRLSVVHDEGATMEVAGREVRLGLPPGVRESMRDIVPLGRPGRVEEAAGAIAFLCSPWSDYVTGHVLTVSGGATAGMTA
jgi:3-oxoacyl-[acyl-carrier protein] reductase